MHVAGLLCLFNLNIRHRIITNVVAIHYPHQGRSSVAWCAAVAEEEEEELNGFCFAIHILAFSYLFWGIDISSK